MFRVHACGYFWLSIIWFPFLCLSTSSPMSLIGWLRPLLTLKAATLAAEVKNVLQFQATSCGWAWIRKRERQRCQHYPLSVPLPDQVCDLTLQLLFFLHHLHATFPITSSDSFNKSHFCWTPPELVSIAYISELWLTQLIIIHSLAWVLLSLFYN